MLLGERAKFPIDQNCFSRLPSFWEGQGEFRLLQFLLCAALAQTSTAAPIASVEAEQHVTDAVPAQPAEAVASASVKLPALIAVELRVVDEVTSKTAVAGMPVKLTLAHPLYVADDLGIPAGTAVEGVVIHAAKGGMAGKSGELLIGAKRIRLSETVSIPLRSFKLGPAKGRDNETLAFATAVAVGLPALLISGGSAKIPAGSVANAKTQADAEIPIALLSKLPPMTPAVTPPGTAAQAPNPQPVPTQGESK